MVCPYANSWPHTSACVTCLQAFTLVSAHSHHARHWSHHGTLGVDCTVPRGPTNCQYGPVRPHLAGSVHFLCIPPLSQLPCAVCAGLFSAFGDLTSLIICPLASHLQRLRSSQNSIPTQHSFPLTRQSTCASIALSILCRTTFLTDLRVN